MSKYKESLQAIASDKLDFEENLANLISKEMQKFQDKTGLALKDIDVALGSVESLGLPKTMLISVSVELEL